MRGKFTVLYVLLLGLAACASGIDAQREYVIYSIRDVTWPLELGRIGGIWQTRLVDS